MTQRVDDRARGRSAGGVVTRCPECGSLRIARIVYGEPPADARLEAEIRAGRIVLGGCVVAEDQPDVRCANCGTEFAPGAPGSTSEGLSPESLTTRLLPRHPRPGSWRVGRLVLTGAAQSEKSAPDRCDLLSAAFDELRRQGVIVRYLVTPAGFFRPEAPPELDPTHGWDTTLSDFETLRRVGEASVAEQLGADTLGRARGHVSYLVLGADVRVPGRGVYAETALVYDVDNARFVGSTGKTYPTTKQERRLVRNPDVTGHVLDVGGEQVAVLVCHDLIAWSPWGAASRGPGRDEVATQLQAVLAGRRPTTVLHLPHTTHSAQTWAQSWACIASELTDTQPTWASAIRYRRGYARPPVPLGPELLARTKSSSDNVLDIVQGDQTSLEPGASPHEVG